MRTILIWLVFTFPLLAGAGEMRIGVSVLPLEGLVRAVAGESVEVQSLQQEGDSCSVFEPRPSAITWLSRADLFLRVGAAYETVITEKLDQQFPGLVVLDFRDAVEVLPLGRHSGHAHDHDHHACESCTHGEATDPHVWLDPVRLAQMAGWLATQLSELDPSGADAYRQSAEAYAARMLDLHEQLSEKLKPMEGGSFYVYHPALAYFAARYGLEQIAIAATDEGPSARELHRLIGMARESGVRAIIVQPQESRKHAQVLAGAIGAELLEIDPMAVDVEDQLLRIADILAKSVVAD